MEATWKNFNLLVTEWQIDGETVADFIFLGSKITAVGDCSHEIKRCLLLERKVMTNLESILKSRDITLPTKVRLVKAIVFPVVMYGCELDYKGSWTQMNLCFWTMVLEKTLDSPLDCKEIQPVHPKEISRGCSLEELMMKLKLQYLATWWGRADSFEKTLMLGKIEGKRRRGEQKTRWLDDVTNSVAMSLLLCWQADSLPLSHQESPQQLPFYWQSASPVLVEFAVSLGDRH